MKHFIIFAAMTLCSLNSYSQNLSSARSIKRKAVQCTGEVIKWMYRKSRSTNKNLVVFSRDFDKEFLVRQKQAGKKNFGLRGDNRVREQKMFMVEVTNLLLDKQKPFMRDCIRLHYISEKKCDLDPQSGGRSPSCMRSYINNLNLAAIREKNRR